MQNNIYEVSSSPIPAEQRAKAGTMPDWFFERICDYAENATSEERESGIQTLSRILNGHCTREGSRLTISPEVKQSFFRKAFLCFCAAAKALAQTDYTVFAGIQPAPAFQAALSGLNESYEDIRDIYIYVRDDDALIPLDRWLRSADFSHPFYIGGTIKYHC